MSASIVIIDLTEEPTISFVHGEVVDLTEEPIITGPPSKKKKQSLEWGLDMTDDEFEASLLAQGYRLEDMATVFEHRDELMANGSASDSSDSSDSDSESDSMAARKGGSKKREEVVDEEVVEEWDEEDERKWREETIQRSKERTLERFFGQGFCNSLE